jgi:hypothetical protein
LIGWKVRSPANSANLASLDGSKSQEQQLTVAEPLGLPSEGGEMLQGTLGIVGRDAEPGDGGRGVLHLANFFAESEARNEVGGALFGGRRSLRHFRAILDIRGAQ